LGDGRNRQFNLLHDASRKTASRKTASRKTVTMKMLLTAAIAALLTFGAVSAALADCPGGAHKKTTADTTTTQDVKKGS
jgi:hypothetical protein